VYRIVKKSISFADDSFERFSCVVLEGNKVVYDSTGNGHPLKITDKSIAAAKLPETCFVDLDHSAGVLNRIGFADNFKRDGNRILADIHVIRTTQAGRDAIALLQEKLITDVSVKMVTDESYSRQDRMSQVNGLEIMGLSIVTSGADSAAKVFA